MKKIIAIGGGEIGRPGTEIETEEIDREIIRLSGKKHPKLLFLPTASGDHSGYIEVVRKYFGEKLGCDVDTLYLVRQISSEKEIQDKIMGADIIYVGGGNTLKMMKIWRKQGVDQILRLAHESGKILCGISAGSICWFEYGQSDSWKSANPKRPYIKVGALGLISALHAPHFSREIERCSDLKSIMKRTTEVAIALEDCVALEVIDDEYRIISSKKGVRAYKCYFKSGKYIQEIIPQLKEFSKLEELLKK